MQPLRERHTSVAVIGAGLTGMATAARLAVRGRPVAVFEAHRSIGGCSGYFRRRGFAFDVGSTTLVDYGPTGAGGQLLREVGLPDTLLEHLPGYLAWIADQPVTLHADAQGWERERASAFGDTPGHRRLWTLIDTLARAFTSAGRHGARLPITSWRGLADAARALPPRDWPLLRYLRWTLDDAIAWADLKHDARLRAFMSMVVQDTVHSDPSVSPLVNAALGLSIRGAISRPRGGMFGFWSAFERRAVEMDVVLEHSTPVESVHASGRGETGRFRLCTPRGECTADVVVCTLPIWDAARIGPPAVAAALQPWCLRDDLSLGSAALLSMGVPDDEVAGHRFTHHQFLPEPGAPLGDGNNCFLSVSSPEDETSAPRGHRSVMISTHVEIDPWMTKDPESHDRAKQQMGDRLLSIARTAYPELGRQAQWLAVASPRTYARFTRRHRGSVGGTRLSLKNSNQRAVPHDIGVNGWIQAGDTTWPGLGTTACAISSRIAADEACRLA